MTDVLELLPTDDVNIQIHKILNRTFMPDPNWTKNKLSMRRKQFRHAQLLDIQEATHSYYRQRLLAEVETFNSTDEQVNEVNIEAVPVEAINKIFGEGV